MANLAASAGNRTPVEIMVTQDEIDRTLRQRCQLRQGGTEDVALGNIARDDQGVGLLVDGPTEPSTRGLTDMIEMDVSCPGGLMACYDLLELT